MKIKSYKGYKAYDCNYTNNKQVHTHYIIIDEYLTEDDFVIEKDRVYKGEPDAFNWNCIYAELVINLKPEVREVLEKVLPMSSRDYSGRVVDGWGKFFRCKSITVGLNGCRSDESKKRKVEQKFQELKDLWPEKKKVYMTKLIEKANEEFTRMVKAKNELYMDTSVKIFNGQSINEDWVKEELPTKPMDDKIAYLESEISKLEEQLSEAKEQRKKSRNKQMRQLCEKDGWKIGRSKMPSVLIEKLKEIYEQNEAFADSSCIFGKRYRG